MKDIAVMKSRFDDLLWSNCSDAGIPREIGRIKREYESYSVRKHKCGNAGIMSLLTYHIVSRCNLLPEISNISQLR